MGLLDALNQVKKENYDPKKDDFNSGFQPIPDGTYTVSLSGVNHGVWSKSQTDFVRFSFSVVTGEQAGRQEHVEIYLNEIKKNGEPVSDETLRSRIKEIQKIGAMVGFDVPDKVFMGENETENYEMIQDAFQNANVIGKLLQLTIKTSPNKKNPDNPWRNYKFDMVEQPKVENVDDPFAGNSGSEEKIDESKLPF